jgi:hypothetical protein
MILEVALGIVLGVVMLVVGFHALAWIVEWWSRNWERALLFGIPLGLLVHAAQTNNPGGAGWSGLLLIGVILWDLWRQHKEKVRARERIKADMVREARKWHDCGEPAPWETHNDKW